MTVKEQYCKCCKGIKLIKEFIHNDKTFKQCNPCRKKKSARENKDLKRLRNQINKAKIRDICDKSILIKKIDDSNDMWIPYKSIKDVIENVSELNRSGVSKVLNGTTKQTKGYILKYTESNTFNKEKIGEKFLCNKCCKKLDKIKFILNDKEYRYCNDCRDKEIESEINNKNICIGCKTLKGKVEFKDNKNRIMKKCKACRTKIKEKSSNKWKQDNKQRISDYNKLYKEKKKGIQKTKKIIQARLLDGEWENFNSASDLAKKKNLKTPNISMVLNGKMNRTGGYEIRRNVIDLSNNEVKRQKILQKTNWTEIVEDKGYTTVKGSPSPNRIQHEIKDDVIGKKCCTCKKWKPLNSGYNNCSNHWDGFRVDCKKCISEYRKLDYVKLMKKKYNMEYQIKNREQIYKKHKEWLLKNKEKYKETHNKYCRIWSKRKRLIDPIYKITKNMRCRMYLAIKRNTKSETTNLLLGCNIQFLKKYLEKQFTNDMSWSNYGKKWHIDHIIPCASWDLSIPEQQFMCFNYRNLRPLDGIENIKKKDKFIPEEKEAYELLYSLEVNEINEQAQSFIS